MNKADLIAKLAPKLNITQDEAKLRDWLLPMLMNGQVSVK